MTWYMTFNKIIVVCRHYLMFNSVFLQGIRKFVLIMISNKEMLYYGMFGTVKLCSRVRGI